MGSLAQRGLFWRVYLTLLGSLLVVAMLAALVWHELAQQPIPGATGYPGAILSALMPDDAAPVSEADHAVRRTSAAVGGRVVLLDARGRPISAADHGESLPISSPSNPPPHAASGPMTRVWRVHLIDGRVIIVETPSRFGGGGPHIVGMLLAIAAAVGLAAFPIVSRLTRRLERLRTSLDAWGAGRLQARAVIEGNDEIAAVAASFNAAADRVEGLLAAHKALLAHASHELRSPLARLRMAVEMFADKPDPVLRPAIVADIAELDGLVEEILLASRLDHSPDLPDLQRVDLLALAAEETARAGVRLADIVPETQFEIEGSSRWLRRMIRNLIENATKHGQAPVEVELSNSGARDRRILITVRDQGPGIPPTEQERVFEPFYRPQGRAEAAGSWGLGLSIVRQIAERHGGRAYCALGQSGGRFVVELPLDRAAP